MGTSEDVIAQQTALYGEPLADKFARLLSAYRISQSRLAAVIGLSAPMLSQVASGQRVKISNPAVYARLLRLEELANSPGVRSGDPTQLNAALEQAAASRPVLTTQQARPSPSPAGDMASPGAHPVATHLAAIAAAADLRAAAAAATGSPALAALLHEAATQAAGPAG
jgi:transcriptional regulator with XRE-family HTH domain